MGKKTVEKIVLWAITITLMVSLIVIVPTRAQAVTKSSKKCMVTLILNDGTKVKANSDKTVPLSKLKGAKWKITGAKKGYAYKYVTIASIGDYWIEEDPNPNFAYGGLIYNKATATSKFKKEQSSIIKSEWSVNKTKLSSKLKVSDYIYKSISEGTTSLYGDYTFQCNNFYVGLQEIKSNGTEGKYYYEQNWNIDLDK